MIEFTAIVQHFYPQRRKYLAKVIDHIRNAHPKEIILWNNADTDIFLDDVTSIRSSRNTLMGRYAAAMLAQTGFVYIQDDDLLVEPESIQALVQSALTNSVITGITGMALNRESEKPYTEGHAKEGACEVVLGRSFACHRGRIANALFHSMHRDVGPGRSDDIWLSMVNRGGSGLGQRANFTNLDEEHTGLSHEPQHYDERNAFALEMIRQGY